MPPQSRLVGIAVLFVFVLAACDSAGESPDASEPSESSATDPAFASGQYPMEVETQGGGTMYRASNNEVTVRIPFVSLDSLVLETNGQTVAGPEITVAPTGDDVTISAYKLAADSSRTLLRTRTLPVIDPPRPEIRLSDSQGRQLISGDTFSKSRPVLEVRVDADRTFATTYPSDARYRFQRALVSVRSGAGVEEVLGTFSLSNGSTLSLTREIGDAQTGDLLIVEFQDILRINAAGQALPVSLRETTRTFAFVLS